jgi:hypothetical protein
MCWFCYYADIIVGVRKYYHAPMRDVAPALRCHLIAPRNDATAMMRMLLGRYHRMQEQPNAMMLMLLLSRRATATAGEILPRTAYSHHILITMPKHEAPPMMLRAYARATMCRKYSATMLMSGYHFINGYMK